MGYDELNVARAAGNFGWPYFIGANRAWLKSYGVVVSLTKNPKTPLSMSMNLMARLTAKDLQKLAVDRNVPEALRISARKKIVAAASGKG